MIVGEGFIRNVIDNGRKLGSRLKVHLDTETILSARFHKNATPRLSFSWPKCKQCSKLDASTGEIVIVVSFV